MLPPQLRLQTNQEMVVQKLRNHCIVGTSRAQKKKVPRRRMWRDFQHSAAARLSRLEKLKTTRSLGCRSCCRGLEEELEEEEGLTLLLIVDTSFWVLRLSLASRSFHETQQKKKNEGTSGKPPPAEKPHTSHGLQVRSSALRRLIFEISSGSSSSF